ncbi:STM4015 family protein [Yinghuangia seranimata]|uniref:STM4015 family protein n=1 Tax=Yinghuangia seranimata TaxID=408067 RepID=UPI00248BF564|nr:STM4015 family protein [Yinghuangia seranimata]MDI2131550.1 STM4015 family protein [Yinghuangia seranimata]
MGIYRYLEHFGGLPVADLRPAGSKAASLTPGTHPDDTRHGDEPRYGIAPDEYAPDAVAWRVRYRYWEDAPDWADHFRYFLDTVDTTKVTALIIGAWSEDLSEDEVVIPSLVEAADRFPALRHLFVGEAVQEESELTWIEFTRPLNDVLDAFPNLTGLGVRGFVDVNPGRHPNLRRLTMEGMLTASIARGLGACEFPLLETLELWLGVAHHGGTATPEDLAQLLEGARTPALRQLALLNSERQDDFAAALAAAPVVAGLKRLDLSMGTFGDEGAEALLGGQPLGHLEEFVVNHHFMSEPMTERLRTTLADSGVDVVLSAPEERRDWGVDGRYVEVAE